MTLEEAIKHEEEAADSHERIKQIKAVTLEECRRADEHRQLAEWLRKLKRLREQEPFMNKPCVAHQICHEDKVKVLDKIRAEILRHSYEGFELGGFMDGYYTAMTKVLDIINKCKAEREDENQ